MIPEFKTIEERFDYLRANKRLIVAQKKSAIKLADPLQHLDFSPETGLYASKAVGLSGTEDFSVIQARLAINTTNLMDSHDDVHIPGLWSKSLKERKDLYLLKEHKLSFENIISDAIKASADRMSWKLLGFKYEGETEVLVFDSTIEKDRNPYMAEQYAKGRVKQHSVGMYYVKLFLCMNSENKYDQEEKANWDKYISQVVNLKDAEAQGYFWAVTEAKVIEGSAVPLGSNFATPVISIEPVDTTQGKSIEPPVEALDIDKLINAFSNKNKN
jgi:hypothetical protein